MNNLGRLFQKGWELSILALYYDEDATLKISLGGIEAVQRQPMVEEGRVRDIFLSQAMISRPSTHLPCFHQPKRLCGL